MSTDKSADCEHSRSADAKLRYLVDFVNED